MKGPAHEGARDGGHLLDAEVADERLGRDVDADGLELLGDGGAGAVTDRTAGRQEPRLRLRRT